MSTPLSPDQPDTSTQQNRLWLLFVILLLTLNLRAAITGVGPLIPTIQAELGLSSGLAGMLTSLPLFAFAFISPYAANIARSTGMEKALFIAMLLLIFGLFIRYLPGISLLYAGTLLIGIGIAICNVLVPGLIRREFSQRLPFVMALFTMVLVSFGGLGSALAVPLQQLSDWRFSMLAWIFPAIIALLLWGTQLKHNRKPEQNKSSTAPSIWRSGLAWQVSIFMGCQSSAFYMMIAWLPSILADQGVSLARAGWILFIFQCFVMLGVITIPFLIKLCKDQRLLGAACSSLNVLAYFGLLLSPQHALGWMVILGLGCGASLPLAMTLFALRTSSVAQTVSLSGMAQSIGYLVAALTPILLGIIHDWQQSWSLPLAIMVFVTAVQVIAAYLAGRPLVIEE